MADAEKKKITVSINGKNYTLIHDETDEYIHRIARYLDAKVAAASRGGLQLGEQTAVVMTAITITDELFKTQKNFNTLKNEIRRMMDEYDKISAEKEELETEIRNWKQQADELNKQLLKAKMELEKYK